MGSRIVTGDYSGVTGKIRLAHHKTGGIAILIFPILLWVFDAFIASYEGLVFSLDSINLQSITGFFLNSLFLIIAIIFIVIRHPSREELPFFIAIIALFAYIAGFIWYNLWILVHLLFAVFVFGYFLKGFDRSEPITGAHWMFFIIVMWDIFDFPLVQWININGLNSTVIEVLTNTLLFPIWLFYFIIFMKEGGWKNTAIILIFLFYIGYIGFQIPDIAAKLSEISPEQREAALTAPGKVVQNYVNVWKKWLGGQIQYAITGKVEQNQYEPLGVYLENVKSADPKYYEGEDIVIWGTVRARTLDDPVNVKLGCYVKDGIEKTYTDNVDPNVAFPVFTLEEQDFACTFKKDFSNILKSGSNTITTFADFNFETLAFLKVYFMDRERLRAMTRENLDPFDQFGIKDKKPITIYTNGPAAIGMETTSPLIGVSNSYIAFPRVSMSIQNNQGWQGKIKKFEEVILLLPKGVGLTSPETDCGERKFTSYTSDQCKQNSCGNVNKACIDVCENGYSNEFDKRNCKASCDDKLRTCENDCAFLFEEEDQKYEGFALDKADLEKINTKLAKDDSSATAENFEFFRCKLSPKPEEVLGNSPITTKSIRAKIRYDYTVEKPVSVSIQKLTTEERVTKIGEVAITGRTETETMVIQLANSFSANAPLAVSVANYETRGRFNHCKDGTSSCGTSNTANVNCNTAGSCGVMQLNKNTHCAWFNPELCDNDPSTNRHDCSDSYIQIGVPYDCGIWNNAKCNAGESAYDIDCNAKLGIAFLQQLYTQYGNQDISYSCSNQLGSVNAKYSGWDAVLRRYNGLGCGSGADPNYVEEVNKIKVQYETGTLGDKAVAPPTNLLVYSHDFRVVVLEWVLSADDSRGANDVDGYNVYRKKVSGEYELLTETKLSRGTAKYTDTSADISGTFEYYYYVETIDKNNNKAKSTEVEFSSNALPTE